MAQSIDAKRWEVVERYWGGGGKLCNPLDCNECVVDRSRASGLRCLLLENGGEPSNCPAFVEPEEEEELK